jgi:hypothetical protein
MHEWFHPLAQGSDGVAKDLAPENAATTKKRVCIWTAMTNRGRELRPVAGQSSIISNGNVRGEKGRAKNSACQVGVFHNYSGMVEITGRMSATRR